MGLSTSFFDRLDNRLGGVEVYKAAVFRGFLVRDHSTDERVNRLIRESWLVVGGTDRVGHKEPVQLFWHVYRCRFGHAPNF